MAESTFELTVGELAARAGVQTSALRFYEKQGLIHSRRTTGNQRRYHRAMLRRVAFIRASQGAGVGLDEIGWVLSQLGNDESPGEEMWERAAQCWDDRLSDRIATLQRIQARLTTCVGCGCLSLKECHLINPEDKYAEEGAGPRRLIHD